MESRGFRWFLLFLAFALLINIGTLTLYHEEPRRGIVTFEMLKTGNFLQPTVLEEPYYKKPPFHNWVLSLSAMVFGSVSEVALRFPSVLSVLLTSLLIFWFVDKFFDRRRALLSSLIFSTFYIVLFGYGSKCEPDTLFTLLVSSSILLWFYLMERGRELPAWIVGYFLTSLAALTKGLPAVHFFLISVGVYFFLSGNFRRLFSFNHFLGLAVGLLPFVGWLFSVKTEQAVITLISEVISRSPGHTGIVKTLKNYFSFPFRFVGATFPWSLVFIYYFIKGRINPAESLNDRTVRFLLLSFFFNLLVYWVFPGSRLRYVMPILPLLAVLLAVWIGEIRFVHKRAKDILRFTVELLVPIGIVAGVVATHNPSFILKQTILFLIFAYLFYFFFMPRINYTPVVVLFALLMLLLRGFYSSYYISVAEYKYPPVREVAREIAELTKDHQLYTKTKYLQLCFYVEKYRDRILPFSKNPPKDSLFLSSRKEGNVLKEFPLGKRKFYLCSFSLKTISDKTSEEGALKVKSQ